MKTFAFLAQAQNDIEFTYEPGAGGVVAGMGSLVVALAIGIVMIAALWKVFTKAGQPGWACIVPIYNAIVILQIVGRPIWWIVLLLIPFVNVIVGIIVAVDLAKSFGKGVGFALGLIFLGPIFYLILGFGSARYVGPAASTGTAA